VEGEMEASGEEERAEGEDKAMMAVEEGEEEGEEEAEEDRWVGFLIAMWMVGTESEEEEEEEGGGGIEIFRMTTKSVMSGSGRLGFLVCLKFLLADVVSNHSPKNA
jgi:hypothetical protein